MVLQNESVDEDLEHFEDIADETDNEPPAASKKEQDPKSVQNHDKTNTDSDSSEGEENPQASSSEDDVSDGEQLLMVDGSNEFEGSQPSDLRSNQGQESCTASSLPGGYNPRHREPCYSNADHVSWWELMVLASHVHPSVATMAKTLLSGANIVYHGNPLNDLSLTAFLDKFMEKKPKQTTWHGGSEIEPAKQLDMSNHLIGPEILSLAEVDVPPEDLVFHKFYMNKMNTSKVNKKKKKKTTAENDAEELFEAGDADEVDGGDESDNEEIDNMLEAADLSFESDGKYDYDDLDDVANKEDDDLIGNVSDAEIDAYSDFADEEDLGTIVSGNKSDDDIDDDDDDVNIGDADDGSDDGESFGKRKGKRKMGGKVGASPFASLEDYEHLLEEDNPTEKKSTKRARKKRRSSK